MYFFPLERPWLKAQDIPNLTTAFSNKAAWIYNPVEKTEWGVGLCVDHLSRCGSYTSRKNINNGRRLKQILTFVKINSLWPLDNFILTNWSILGAPIHNSSAYTSITGFLRSKEKSPWDKKLLHVSTIQIVYNVCEEERSPLDSKKSPWDWKVIAL